MPNTLTPKWGAQYWTDLGERTASTGIAGVITMLTADASGAISGSGQQWWLIVGLPSALTVLKGLLVNLGGNAPTASVVNVTSNGDPKPHDPTRRAEDGEV